MNDSLRSVIEWTREALSADAKAFLSSRAVVRPRRPDVLRACLGRRAGALGLRRQPGRGAAQRRRRAEPAYTFSGHVHDQELYFRGAQGRMSVVPPDPGPGDAGERPPELAGAGRLGGQPRDGNPAAAYALFDAARERIAFHRVPYDHLAAARKIREAGLPLSVAYRVERGT